MKRRIQELRIGLIGCGYWGTKLLHVIKQIPEMTLVGCFPGSQSHSKKIAYLFPELTKFHSTQNLLKFASLEAVVIATPASTHFRIARAALAAGKHVFIEKPMTLSLKDADALVSLASEKQLLIQVDHTYLYAESIRLMKRIIENGELGTVYAFTSTRANFGRFQEDCDVLWDLATHDVAIFSYLFGNPTAVTSTGISHFGKHADMANILLEFGKKIQGHIYVNWLSPDKVRRITIIGTEKMLVYDETKTEKKIRVLNQSATFKQRGGKRQFQYKIGDEHIPSFVEKEALRVSCESFAACIRNDTLPVSSGIFGRNVVAVLEAAHRSLRKASKEIFHDSFY